MPYTEQQVTSVRKWSDKTFSLTTTRPENFQFKNGEFVTLGLRPEGKLIARAYSIVSTNDADHLEFLSIHVPDGPLTSRLVHISEGDGIWINTKATGSLTLDYVRPGRNLYLLATGTGLAPFMSLIRAPETYSQHERVILVHTVRTVPELAYRHEIEALCDDKLRYVPTVTQEPFEVCRRGADLFRSGELSEMLGLPVPDPEHDRVMLCGNPHMNEEMTDHLEANGWVMTNYKGVGNFTVEKAFVLAKDD
ncbi:ferredoxin--NADP reductase [Acidihalobacter prosperus]|uniref:ferredoxin--NADP(+) reductase n=1 Tax=Acidihalobacter prosperus TaxID=160660 RepID=A0A1A6C1N0_9GAMM|nr:ferredoxin--NADP reductase [Acidihalobacter prosperus]OBS08455.1 ferredoxin--NADP(+) reductase [Acidihalobacter prosperus]